MLNWIETIEELPEVGKVNDYFSSGVILGYYDEEDVVPYIICMFERGEGKDEKEKVGEWQHWVCPCNWGEGWVEMPGPPDFWAEVNPPK